MMIAGLDEGEVRLQRHCQGLDVVRHGVMYDGALVDGGHSPVSAEVPPHATWKKKPSSGRRRGGRGKQKSRRNCG